MNLKLILSLSLMFPSLGFACIGSVVSNALTQINSGDLEANNKQTQIAMDSAQNFFENRKQCRSDLADAKTKLMDAQQEHANAQNLLSVKIRKARLEYKNAILALKQQCNETAGKQFNNYKGIVADGVVTAEEGGPQALVNRNNNINRYRKLFYDDCLASELNIEAVKLKGEELNANIEEIQKNLENSANTLANITQKLTLTQKETIEICKMADELQETLTELGKQQASSAAATNRSNAIQAALGNASNCIFGPRDNGNGTRQSTQGSQQ